MEGNSFFRFHFARDHVQNRVDSLIEREGEKRGSESLSYVSKWKTQGERRESVWVESDCMHMHRACRGVTTHTGSISSEP